MRPRVTAGLIWPPEIGPSTVPITAIENAWPNAAYSWFPFDARTEPAPPTTRVKAPINSPIPFRHQSGSTAAASSCEGGCLFMAFYSTLDIINRACGDLRDVPRVPAVEVGDDLEPQLPGLPRRVRVHEVREEPAHVLRDLRDDVVLAEEGPADLEREGAAPHLVHEPQRVQVLVEEDVERVVLVQVGLGVLDPHQRDLVHHDHVRRDDVERAEPAVRVVPEVREGEHQPAPGPAEVLGRGELHDLEHVGEGPRAVNHLLEVHGAPSPRDGLKSRPAESAAEREEVDPLEARQEVDPVGDAEERGGDVHDPPDLRGPPSEDRVAEAESEQDHPRHDPEAEHPVSDEEPLDRQARHHEGSDQQDEDLVVAREPVDDPDPEHGSVLPVPPEVPVRVVVFLHSMRVGVVVEEAEPLEGGDQLTVEAELQG